LERYRDISLGWITAVLTEQKGLKYHLSKVEIVKLDDFCRLIPEEDITAAHIGSSCLALPSSMVKTIGNRICIETTTDLSLKSILEIWKRSMEHW